MHHLIIGAGATLAEAQHLGCPQEFWPPLINNFAQKTWTNYTPHPLLEIYLHQLGYNDLGEDPREVFYRLEAQGQVNIEKFFEFAWGNRHIKLKVDPNNIPPGYISGLRIVDAESEDLRETHSTEESFWENFLYHGIGSPLAFLMQQCFFENGEGWKDLVLSKRFAANLNPGDLVLNLNYDTVFELALLQANKLFTYSPFNPKSSHLLVSKPHGSLNMVVNERGFTFGQPEWLGMPQPKDYRSYSGLIPPYLNKNYSKHPTANIILKQVAARKPECITMWGVGFTESDIDLVTIYRAWASHVKEIEIINPSKDVAEHVRELVSCPVKHFQDISEWEETH